MGKILCATRGGEASHTTQDAVIALAKEQGDELVFLFVADTSFMNHLSVPNVVDMESSLEKMGHFLLVIAQERAAKKNVVARTIVRKGTLREELIIAAEEIGATMIVLGHSSGPDSAFEDASLKSFVNGIQSQTGIQVCVLPLRNGDSVDQVKELQKGESD